MLLIASWVITATWREIQSKIHVQTMSDTCQPGRNVNCTFQKLILITIIIIVIIIIIIIITLTAKILPAIQLLTTTDCL